MEFDFNISGLDPSTARELIMDVARALGDTQAQLDRKRDQLALWRSRLELANEHGRAELITEADQRVHSLQSEVDAIFAEAQSLRRGIAFMKDQLKSPSFAVPQNGQSEFLLEELKQLVGVEEDSQLHQEDQWKEQSLDDALAALKKEMGEKD